MAIRMFARRRTHVEVGVGTDQVLFGITLPSDTVVNSVRAKVSLATATRLTPLSAPATAGTPF